MKTEFISGSLLCIASSFAVADTDVFADMESEDQLICGISTGTRGFSAFDEKSNYSGVDVDFCRAVAAAVFGDDSRVSYVELEPGERFEALLSGEVDMLARNTTWTLERDAGRDFEFLGVLFHDGQEFLSNNAATINDIEQLSEQSICVQFDTTSEENLKAVNDSYNIDISYETYTSPAEIEAAFIAEECTIYTNDSSALAGFKSTLNNSKGNYVLGNLRLSNEPLGPLVTEDQSSLADVGRWVLNTLIQAEELGISSHNVDQLAQNPENISQERLLTGGGDDRSYGACLGLDADWAYNVILQVGNYGEIFEANVGAKTALGLVRGKNALHRDGGLMYSLPLGRPCR